MFGWFEVSVDFLAEGVEDSGGYEDIHIRRFFWLVCGTEASLDIGSCVPKIRMASSAMRIIENPRWDFFNNSSQQNKVASVFVAEVWAPVDVVWRMVPIDQGSPTEQGKRRSRVVGPPGKECWDGSVSYLAVWY